MQGLRVVELSRGIGAAYTGKLFADAGAEVVVVEGEGGHPLRRWRAQEDAMPGLLFDYLAAGKRSVTGTLEEDQVRSVIGAADLVIEDQPPGTVPAADLLKHRPELVVASISPFGQTGPWRDRPATDAVIQAWSGSTGRRGMPGRPPVQAGNQICEWVAGMYAAAAASSVLYGVSRGRVGGQVDVSMLEAAAIGLDAYSMVVKNFNEGRVDQRKSMPRSPLVPAIEKTVDGLVGMMPNTARQWEDFFYMIGRPDFAEDGGLLQIANRMARMGELEAAVRSWTEQHTTAEVIETASAFRIPVAMVGNGETVLGFDQLVQRQVFRPNANGDLQPRVPYRITADPSKPREDTPFRAAPALGSTSGPAASTDSDSAESTRDGAERADYELPLQGLKVLDFSAFWAAPAMTHVLACLGADVIKIESVQRPDGMRQATSRPTSPLWYEWGGIHQPINVNKRGITLDLTREPGVEVAKRLVAWADVVVENFTPRVMDAFGLSWETIHAINPDVHMLRMPAFGLSGPWGNRAGFAMTIEQMSGLSYVTGYPEAEVPLDIGGVCDPIGGVHAVFALMVALRSSQSQDGSGAGRLIEVPLIEAALNVTAEQVLQFSRSGRVLERQGNHSPQATPQGVFECATANEWVAISVADDEQWMALRSVVGDPELDDPELGSEIGRRDNAELVEERLRTWCSTLPAREVHDRLVAMGVPVGIVGYPSDIEDNPHLKARNFFESVDHPVSGTNALPSLPFKLSTGPQRWYRSAAPTLGRDNEDVLMGLLGLSREEYDALEEDHIIGTVPV